MTRFTKVAPIGRGLAAASAAKRVARTAQRLAWAALAAAPCANAASAELEGTTPAGSAYRIAVPQGWQPGDGLVLVQHGHRFASVLQPGLGPSAQAMLADGYAIAAPGYRQTGWAVGGAVQDNADVLAAFRARVGEPGRVVAHGGSMGALIALKLAEDPALANDIDAVVALCPAVDGVDFWDRMFDLRLVYDTLCDAVPGGRLPAGDAPTPFAGNLDVLAGAPADPLALPATMRALPAVQACLALHLPAAQRSAAQDARVAGLRELLGSDEETLAALLAYAHFGLADVLRSPDKLDGVNPFHNEELHYRRGASSALPAGLDAAVPRIPRDDFARLAFHRSDSLDGHVGVPVVAVQTSLDATQRRGNLRYLRHRLGDRVTVAVARETVPTHCGFTQAEYDAAWDAGRAAGEGTPASFAGIAAACAGRDPGACRFDAAATQDAAVVGLAEPRQPLGAGRSDELSHGGLWWDAARPAQGLMIEELDDPIGSWGAGEQRIAVTWYTWAPQSDPDPGPRWFHGVGRVYGHAATVDLLEVRGGRFGVLLEPAAVAHVPWGRLELSFGGEDAQARYVGPSTYGSGSLALRRLTKAGSGLGGALAFSPPLSGDYSRAGAYYDPLRPAGGWVLNQYAQEHVDDEGSLLLWFTWDANGRPIWLYGLDGRAADGLSFRMQWAMSGGRFEPGYPLSQVQFRDWGDVALQSTPCAHDARITQVDWRADTHGFGDGHVPVARLTRPTELHALPYCPP